MAGNAHLSAKHTPLAHLGATCNAHLSRHHGVAAYLIVVGYLYQIVQLDTLVHDGGSHDGTVYTRVGTYLHIVFDDGYAYLGYLVIAVLGGLESESVGSYHTSCMQDTTASHLTVMIDHGIAIDFRALTHTCVLAYGHMGMEHTSVSDDHALSNGHKGTYVAILAHLSSGVDESQFADALTLGLHALICLKQLCHSFACIGYSDERGAYFPFGKKIVVDKHHATLCLVDVMLVFVIGKETDTSGLALLYLGKVVDLGIGISLYGTSDEACYHLCGKFHI